MISLFSKFTSNVFKNTEEPKQMLFRLKSIFKRRSKKTSEVSPYIITRVDSDDYHRILKLMHESYYINEPTFRNLGFTENSVLDDLTMKALKEGYTIVARCRHDGCITGACINQSGHSWDPDMKEKLACSVQNSKLRSLLLFRAYLQRIPDLWACYDVQKIFEINHLFIDMAHKHQGLEQKLMRESKILASDCGFNLIRCDATSTRLAKLCKDLDMEKIGEIPYKSYLGRDYKPVFDPPHPDLSVKVFIDTDPNLWYLKNVTPQK